MVLVCGMRAAAFFFGVAQPAQLQLLLIIVTALPPPSPPGPFPLTLPAPQFAGWLVKPCLNIELPLLLEAGVVGDDLWCSQSGQARGGPCSKVIILMVMELPETTESDYR